MPAALRTPQDPVVLVEGNLDIAFGRLVNGGALAWSTTWTDATMLPRFVRLLLRDVGTGTDPLGEANCP